MAPPDLASAPFVLPSLMSADFLRLGPQIDALMDAGARAFHIDVMDGRFVPNLTIGTGLTAAVAAPIRARGGLVDVHLMVERPGLMVELFAPHADAISVHVEADPHPHRLLQRIRELGCRAGLSINPGTPLAAVAELVDVLDYVNCMGVNPGFSGQAFIPATPGRIARLRDLLPAEVAIEVDGGVGAATLPPARDAGATLFVSASSIFGTPDPVAAYRELAGLAGAA
ncbi:MAG: ribulose-phosphate 3-epimerase [Actinomycetota bacterium]